ncbi:peptidylprolyl isomerase [Georhizobium profundi]|jgi:peptidyl-prolyl cis-trans isomerase C|uniref:Parvulin-like PPIase n=2 Tax=Hyphomicrobiales TaxID=356 RepID=A0A3S9AZH5_9HYPH|nr:MULTISPECIES: peptidylprolyl isomerase [Hyphomicrobiales]AZN70022.1 peptidylprolyl isomerase [Georhizobium profundi]MCO6389989.1 peptidylprolyl isomerase [Aliihoeflea aestuarii]MDF1599008.1 peptidylprolyl isomerase [Mesorhizobium sp. YIM 152430]TYR29506.1 peptidylprolyl isomerase [Mesorhizobium microcysteis]
MMGIRSLTFRLKVQGFVAVAMMAAMLPPLAHAQDDEVVARVNGQEITAADLAIAEEMYGPQLGQMPEDARRSVLVNALIELRIVADAAREANVTEQDAFKRQLAFFEAQTLRSVFIEQRVADAVTDEAIRAAYDGQVGSFPTVAERKLRHILVGTEDEATDIINALEAGQSFADLAQERSIDAVSKAKGGDLGFVAEGEIMPEVEEAAAELEPGQFTRSPVATAFGFHVVMLEEARNRPPPAFETVEPQIRQALASAEEQRLLAGLRAAAQVEKLVPDVTPPQADDGHDH